MKTPANSSHDQGQNALLENERRIGSDAHSCLTDGNQASAFIELGSGGSGAPAASHSSTEASSWVESTYDPSEDYYANSATQSFLHDTYYPHLYHQDWHETEYDETDRQQSYYHDAAYDAQSYYYEQAYQTQNAYGEPSSDIRPSWHSASSHYPDSTYTPSSPFSFSEDALLAASQPPVIPLDHSNSSSRLTVNREEASSLIDSSIDSSARLTVNRGTPDAASTSVPLNDSGSSRGRGVADHVISASTATLEAAEIAGSVAVSVALSTGEAALQVISNTISTAAREDELVGRMEDGREIIVDAVSREVSKSRTRKSVKAEALLAKMQMPQFSDETSASQAGVRETNTPVDAKHLAEKLREQKALKEKDLGLSESDEEGSPSKTKGEKDKKPVTKRERDLQAKKKQLKNGKLDGEGSSFLINPAQKAKDSLSKGASITKNVAVSSVSKVIANENEDVATLLSMKDAGKKTANAGRNLARLPQKIIRGAQQTARFLQAVWQIVRHSVGAIVAAGWPAVLLLLGIILVTVVVVVGSLAIFNENQEISEVAALVAELDEQLEEELNSYGSGEGSLATSPIYYCDARGTYNAFDDSDEDQTLDVDLRDDASDLQLVDASSVNVYTNPDGIIAYIDAKYGGEWQAGTASWKVTKEWNGKTYNLIDWENVPEWVQAGLNKLDRETFRGNIQELVRDYLMEEVLPEKDYGPRDLETRIVENIAEDAADELANVIYDQQLQDVSDEVVYEAVRASIQEHGDDLIQITDEHLQEMNYQLMEEFTSIVGEQEPVALVYDEIVELHALLNYWSEDYEHIDATQVYGGTGGSGTSGTTNAYGYPNASGYNSEELSKWDGYNEVSVYGISESGTGSVTADGTHIANSWSDTTMAIACEGLQNEFFAYWTSGYKALHPNSNQPVRITLYNPETEKTVTVEVRDCGGWRGFNSRYAGMNATRQWDLLPAVWLALGGTQSSGLMNVYWKVDNEAPLTDAAGAAMAEVTIEDYPWEKETDHISGEISINRATYIRHDIQDLMRNVPRIEKLLGRDNFASDAEYYAVIDFVVMKLKDVMSPVLTGENAEGEAYTDYFMTRRELGDPFGTQEDGAPVEWVVTERFNPGYEDEFDKEKVSVSIRPLNGETSVYAVKTGSVIEVGEGSVTTSVTLDGDVDERIVYGNLKNIQVAVGDEVAEGTKLGALADENASLEVSWYEVFTYVGDLERQRGWAYCPSLFMTGFAGYEEPEDPTEYEGSLLRSLADCETIVDYAHSRLGCAYIWGATGPYTFDCSGLTQWCYAQAGITIPRNSEQQYKAAFMAGSVLPLDESILQPGDILWKRGHVGIYIGNNQYIHAPQTGDVVKISTGISYFTLALRFS